MDDLRSFFYIRTKSSWQDNSDRIIGVTTFAAGGFDATFNLTETPTLDGTNFVDTSLVKDCIANRKTTKQAKKVNRRKVLA